MNKYHSSVFAVSEGNGFFIPSNHKFANIGDADAYFQQHKDELKHLSTFIMIGSLLKVWNGIDNPPTYNNTLWANGWFHIDSDTLPSGTLHDFTSVYDVPTEGVNQVAVVIWTNTPVTNVDIQVSKFDLSVTPSKYHYVFANAESIGESTNDFEDEIIKLRQDNSGMGYRAYDINMTDTPMPIGRILSGLSDIAYAPLVNPVNSNQPAEGEGGIEFTKEGMLSFDGTKLHITNKTTNPVTVTFKYRVKNAAGTITDIVDSISPLVIPAANGAGQTFRMKQFKYHCNNNDIVFLVASATAVDSVSITSLTPNQPMVQSKIVYRKLLPKSFDDTIEPAFAFGVAQVDTVDTRIGV